MASSIERYPEYVDQGLQVQSGTWDFFSDDDFGGNTMRLTAGTYPTLTPDWGKKINSFTCVEPGPGV
ncbi:MAG: hypothetical protein ACLPKB_10265 [Xanthobacteraceae bacterium]